MFEKKNGEGEKNPNSGLMILLLILAIIAIVLIVGIMIVKINNGSQGNGDLVKGNCEYSDNAYSMSICAESFFEDEEDGGVGDFENQYNNLIKEAVQKRHFDIASDLIVNMSRFLVSQGKCNKYANFVNNEDFQEYDSIYQGKMYSYFVEFSRSCEDEENANKWYEKLLIISESEQNGLGF